MNNTLVSCIISNSEEGYSKCPKMTIKYANYPTHQSI